jgi:hypothetical protein
VCVQAGSFDNELLILSKGSARTAERDAITGAYVEFDAGTFWGELQLLGLEEQRMLSVLASSFSEIAAITPTAIHNVRNPFSLRQLLVVCDLFVILIALAITC